LTSFHRLTDVMEGAWVQAVEDLGEDTELTVAKFDIALKAFVAAHSTKQDRRGLIQQLTHPSKPTKTIRPGLSSPASRIEWDGCCRARNRN
jgi:hypothetical protein